MDTLGTIQTYTPHQVFRTAQPYVTANGSSKVLPHGINETCVCCKAGTVLPTGERAGLVERIVNELDLKPWTAFYKTKQFAAYKCRSCGYQWSWFK